jgi:hypothetical protein
MNSGNNFCIKIFSSSSVMILKLSKVILFENFQQQNQDNLVPVKRRNTSVLNVTMLIETS